MPRIIIEVPNQKAQPYIFPEERTRVPIGRGSGNEIVIDCPSISTLHAELIRNEDGGYELRDLGSKNGIRKNRQRKEVISLEDGDRIAIGDATLEFHSSMEKIKEVEKEEEQKEERAAQEEAVAAKTPAIPEKPGILGPIAFAIAGIAAVLYAAFGIEQGTGEVNEWYLFLGRFHPLAVHLPIGLLLVAALFEWLGVIRPFAHLRRAVPALLVLSCLGALAAVYHGVLLAAGSGVLGEAVEDHLWAGVSLTVAMFLLVPARVLITRIPRILAAPCYQLLLLFSLFLLMSASHQGGNITHGKDYLVEYMPEPMRESLSTLPKPIREFIGLVDEAPTIVPVVASELTLYDAVFAGPVGQYCVACHKPDRVRGGLLMHTLDAILAGGESGPAIVYGDLKASELFTRITLPEDDEYHMPPDGRKGFSDQQTEWFRWWIASGIPGDTPVSQIQDAPDDVLAAIKEAIANAGAPEEEAEEKQAVAAATWTSDTLVSINQSLAAGRLVPISRKPEDGLLLTTAGAGQAFNDAQLETLAPVALYIVEADLSRTGVTDGGMGTVATWATLRRLRLDHTVVGDSGVLALGGLADLSSLNLFNTRITSASVDTLLAMPALTSLFVGDTALDEAALARLGELLPVIPPPPEPVEASDEAPPSE